ncbi:MAG: ComEA family DNA-binding protein [Actinobacteria bacterium]|nr:ComEA family DNA-binding protein [Actinomycetota bacterium]
MAQAKMKLSSHISELCARIGLGTTYRPLIVAICVLCLILCGVALWRFIPSSPQTSDVYELDHSAATKPATSQEEEVATVVVDVTGAVCNPNIYELHEGARVFDAIAAAGGARSDAVTSAINLARLLSDGEQIYVPSQEEFVNGASLGVMGGMSSEGGGLVNINTADASGLETLPGIGEATAKKIIADREANGPFASVEDIQRVTGIGEKKFEQIEGSICV